MMMKYVFAFDGGGTKTRLLIGDLKGNIQCDKTTTGSNIFSIGNEPFQEIITTLYESGKQELDIRDEEIALVFLGLSGADLESDYKRLTEACKPIFKDVPFKIVNDAWIILRSGIKTPYGAVCICGTGTNSAAINKTGEKAILRALSYTLGTYGGGLDIAREALHYAFRADELTYEDTLLRTAIPAMLNKSSIAECVDLFYPTRTISKQQFGDITPLVSKCALLGDKVSTKILQNVAYHIALQTVGVIRQVDMTTEQIPVVIGGRVFSIEAPIFLTTFTETIKQYCPNSFIVHPEFAPVVGAYLFALDELHIKQTTTIEENLAKSGGLL
jgi:N-acetylglucosamine kinase-like BadF-type ATPase